MTDPRVTQLEHAEQAVLDALRPLVAGVPATSYELVVWAAVAELPVEQRKILAGRFLDALELLAELMGVLEGDQRIVGLDDEFQPRFA